VRGADGGRLSSGDLSLFVHRVRDLVKRPPVTVGADGPVTDVARTMSREGVGSAVVAADGRPAGIVTDQDLRRRVVEAGRDPARTPVSAIMSAPVITVPAAAFAFDALLAMTRHHVRHLVVVDEDARVIGVVSSRDLLGLHTAHPVSVARDLTRAPSLAALAPLAEEVTGLVRRLLAAGGSVHDIAQLVSELNDRMVVRVLDLTRAELEASGLRPPVAWAWLAFGSEGRREQTLRTDQDNGLVYADPPPELAAPAAAYFAQFADRVVAGLVAIGFPPCPGGAMASNPKWRQPLAVWDGYVRRWIGQPSPEHILAAAMYFDLRCVAGERGLATSLGARIRAEAPAHPRFLGLMARDVVDRRVPVTLFGGVSVQRSGAHRGSVDIKGAGCLQLVGAARVHALELGLAETSTVGRFAGAAGRGLYTQDEVTEIRDAYEHLLRLRLAHQLERLTAGEAPDNYVDPERLSHRDALLLRDALKTVGRVQQRLRERYATDFIPA
jgi:CBS domain-containing protein